MQNLNRGLVETVAAIVVFFLGIVLIIFTLHYFGVNVIPILAVVIAIAPLWLPSILFYITFNEWMDYVHEKFMFKNGRSTVRIMLPQEVLKSPEAMESVFAQLNDPGLGYNHMQTFLEGKHNLVLSFELVSIGGDVRFYANIPSGKRNMLEALLYAQYPGIEIHTEKIDYTGEIVWNEDEWEFMSFHMVKKKDVHLPIKTYIDFKHDMQPKEELKYEPMAPMLEALGKAAPHERFWIQILLKAHRPEGFLKSGSLSKSETWEKKTQEAVDELMQKRGKAPVMRDEGGIEEQGNNPMLTASDRDTVASVERNVRKYAYDVAIRSMYFTKPGKFNAGVMGQMLRSFSAYDIVGQNAIGVTWRTDFDYPGLSDFSGRRRTQFKKDELKAYKMRSYDARDIKGGSDNMKTMSVEELATIYHIPGTSVATPGLSRVETARKEAPPNLPIGNLPT